MGAETLDIEYDERFTEIIHMRRALSFRVEKGRAVYYYSVRPDGRIMFMSDEESPTVLPKMLLSPDEVYEHIKTHEIPLQIYDNYYISEVGRLKRHVVDKKNWLQLWNRGEFSFDVAISLMYFPYRIRRNIIETMYLNNNNINIFHARITLQGNALRIQSTRTSNIRYYMSIPEILTNQFWKRKNLRFVYIMENIMKIYITSKYPGIIMKI